MDYYFYDVANEVVNSRNLDFGSHGLFGSPAEGSIVFLAERASERERDFHSIHKTYIKLNWNKIILRTTF